VIGAGIVFRGAVDHHLGVLAAALGEPAAAGEHLQRALAAHERLGARAWAERSRRELERLAAGPDRGQGGRRARGDGRGRRRASSARRHPLDPRLRRPTVPDARRQGPARPGRAAGRPGPAGRRRRPGRRGHRGGSGPGRPAAGGRRRCSTTGPGPRIRARLLDLEAEIDEAGRWHDPERADRAALERDALVAELAAGHRPRRPGQAPRRPVGTSPQDGHRPGSGTCSTGSSGPTRPRRPPAGVGHHRHLVQLLPGGPTTWEL
jgi:hypothetical protein